MSGPKVDTAVLCQRDKERLMRARTQRMELAAAIGEMVEEIRCGFVPAASDGQEIARVSAHLQQLQKEYTTFFEERLAALADGDETVQCAALRREYDEKMREYRQRSAADMAAVDEARQRRGEAIPVGAVFSGGAPSVMARGLHQKIRDLREEMDALLAQDIPAKYKNAVLGMRDEIQRLSAKPEGAGAAQLWDALARDFQNISALACREREEMQRVYRLYCAQCFDGAPPAALEEFAAPEDIHAAMEARRMQAEEKLSGTYIRRQIDQVMEKYGYELLPSHTLHQQEDGRALYGVNDSTAIQVFVSDQQQVTMRVVGIGFDEVLSPEEDEALFQEQCAFCAMHPKITRELELRGVMLTEKKHLPPDRQYNKKLAADTSASGSRAKRQEKRGGAKVMYRG